MKSFFTLILTFFITIFISAQTDIPVTNGSLEDIKPIFQNKKLGNKWALEGFWFNENSDSSKFDGTNSGLAPGEGRDSSQALKSTIVNSSGKSAEVTLISGPHDISSYGPGTYTYTFYAKAAEALIKRPFWIVVSALYENKKTVGTPVVNTIDNGGTVSWKGLEDSFLEQSIKVKIADNAEGKNVKYLRLHIQHAGASNTYWFDDFKLTKDK